MTEGDREGEGSTISIGLGQRRANELAAIFNVTDKRAKHGGAWLRRAAAAAAAATSCCCSLVVFAGFRILVIYFIATQFMQGQTGATQVFMSATQLPIYG